eukprot:6153830-Karenia_brevis.AAC.1
MCGWQELVLGLTDSDALIASIQNASIVWMRGGQRFHCLQRLKVRSLMVIIIVMTVATRSVAVVELIGRQHFDPTHASTRISYARNAK